MKDRKPNRDLCRNHFLLEIPGFSQKLKEQFLPFLKEAIKRLEAAMDLVRGECLFYENNLIVEDIFFALSEAYIL